MCAWRVDHLNVSYLYKKRGVYYFSKRVPCDVRSYCKSDRIVICLRTKSSVSAVRASKSLYQKLDDYWTKKNMLFEFDKNQYNAYNENKMRKACFDKLKQVLIKS